MKIIIYLYIKIIYENNYIFIYLIIGKKRLICFEKSTFILIIFLIEYHGHHGKV